MKAFREITDQEWGSVEPLLPECRPQSNRDPRGRPMKNRRACMNATLFVMFTGVSWQMLPRKYPSYQTCHRCFKAWYDAGVMHKVAAVLFGHESPDFLGLVAARVRIALRETRGGVDRAVKRTDTGILKKSQGTKQASAVPASSKRGMGGRRSSTGAAAVAVAEQARSKKKMKSAAKVPAGVVAKSPAKPRATAPLKAGSKVPPTKGPTKVPTKARVTPAPTPAEIAENAARATVVAAAVQAAAKRAALPKARETVRSKNIAKPVQSAKVGRALKAVKASTRVAAEASSPPIVAKRGEKPTPTRTNNRGSMSRERAVAGRVEAVRPVPGVTHAVGSRPLKAEAEVLHKAGKGKSGERRATKAVAA